jgi:hypothetical protein
LTKRDVVKVSIALSTGMAIHVSEPVKLRSRVSNCRRALIIQATASKRSTIRLARRILGAEITALVTQAAVSLGADRQERFGACLSFTLELRTRFGRGISVDVDADGPRRLLRAFIFVDTASIVGVGCIETSVGRYICPVRGEEIASVCTSAALVKPLETLALGIC